MKRKTNGSVDKLLSRRPIAKAASYLAYPFYKNRKNVRQAIDLYMDEKQKKDPRLVKFTKREIFYNKHVYRITPAEYFIFRFSDRNDFGKRQFVGDMERNEIMYRVSNEYTRELFSNKYKTYEKFKPYFKREVIRVAGREDRPAFDRFIADHKDIILKPIAKSEGKGVYTADCSAKDFSADALFSRILSEGETIIEERVHQCAETEALHPSSVNTVRMLTKLNKDGSVDLIGTFLRVGRGGACVDNGGSGGLFVLLDKETGIAVTKGIAEDTQEFAFQPDTGAKIIGFHVPRWEEAKALARELAAVVPEQAIIGWDLALTDDGWVLIEGNSRSQFIGWQTTSKEGFRDTLNKYFKEWL